jgi:hypothetical protein
MKNRRKELKGNEDWKRKQRENQKVYAARRKAKFVVGDVIMRADLVR